MLVGIIGAIWVIVEKVGGGFGGVIAKAAAINPALTEFPGLAGVWSPTMALTSCMVIGMSGFAWPRISQRMYATRSLKTIKTLAVIFPVSALFVNIPPVFLGVILFILVSLVTKPALEEVIKRFFDFYDEPAQPATN